MCLSLLIFSGPPNFSENVQKSRAERIVKIMISEKFILENVKWLDEW